MLMAGGFRSIIFPLIGPAATQLPARSQRVCELVEAFAISVPGGTVVISVKIGGELMLRPERLSWSMQLKAWLAACQAPLAVAGMQLKVGEWMSILIPAAVVFAKF